MFFSGPQYSQLIRAPSSPTEELTFPKGLTGSAEHTREKTTIKIGLLVKRQSNNWQLIALVYLIKFPLNALSITESRPSQPYKIAISNRDTIPTNKTIQKLII